MKSAYTNEELENYKSLDAYNQFLCGWVKDVSLIRASNANILIHARVRSLPGHLPLNDSAAKKGLFLSTVLYVQYTI